MAAQDQSIRWCPFCGNQDAGGQTCPSCSRQRARVIRGAVVEMPAGTLSCPGCDRDELPIHFRGWSRLYSLLWWSREGRYSAYLCQDCGHKQTTLSLFMTALLGWWSVPAIFWYGWRSTYLNWRSVWAPPSDPLTWGAMALEDLLASAHEDAEEAARFNDSPLADLSSTELHLVLSADNPYGTLGIPSSSSEAEIKAAWRERAKESHPDVNPNDPEAESQMRKLNQAYEVLRSPRLRAAYDWLVAEGERVG